MKHTAIAAKRTTNGRNKGNKTSRRIHIHRTAIVKIDFGTSRNAQETLKTIPAKAESVKEINRF